MTAKQKAAEKAENVAQLERHRRERQELARKQEAEPAALERTHQRQRRELDMRQLKESFQLSAKYGREIGPGGQSIINGTYKRSRR